jgi:hypothetical protein
MVLEHDAVHQAGKRATDLKIGEQDYLSGRWKLTIMADFPMLRLQSGTEAPVLGKYSSDGQAEVEKRAINYNVEAALKFEAKVMSDAAR